MNRPLLRTPLARVSRGALALMLAGSLSLIGAPAVAFARPEGAPFVQVGSEGAPSSGPLGAQSAFPERFSLLAKDGSLRYRMNEDGAPPGDGYIPVVDGGGYVTPVKYQMPFGSCWAFGYLSAVETSILTQLGRSYDESAGIDPRHPDQRLDLSERHLAWFGNRHLPADDPSQPGEGVHVIDRDAYRADGTIRDSERDADILNFGGTLATGVSPLSDGIGPVFEADWPYRSDEAITVFHESTGEPLWYSAEGTWAVPERERFASAFEVSDANVLPRMAGADPAGVAAGKRELIDGRALAMAIRADASRPERIREGAEVKYTNLEHYAQYVSASEGINHVVTVVGWDDSYPRENFATPGNPLPAHDGAWLAKNSWGALQNGFPHHEEWGVGGTGYFWISYEDASIGTTATFTVSADRIGGKATERYVESYDHMGSEGILLGQPGTVLSANAFPNSYDTDLRLYAISYLALRQGMTVDFSLYVSEGDEGNPDGGRLVGSFSRTFESAGYHRVELPEGMRALLRRGERLSVVAHAPFEDESGEELDLFAVMAEPSAQSPSVEEWGGYYEGVVNPGESLLFIDGSWVDLAAYAPVLKEELAEDLDFYDSPEAISLDNFAIRAYFDPVAPGSEGGSDGADGETGGGSEGSGETGEGEGGSDGANATASQPPAPVQPERTGFEVESGAAGQGAVTAETGEPPATDAALLALWIGLLAGAAALARRHRVRR